MEMDTKHRIVAVIPAFNEERYIGSIVLKMCAHVDTVVIVDDGSTDDTAFLAGAAGAIVVKHDCNNGKGVALNTGFEAARKLNPAVVVTMDGDFQHLPDELPYVIEPIVSGKADIVIGSRYLAKTSNVTTQRALGHWVFNHITNWLSGVPVTDSQSGYRAFSSKALEVLHFRSHSFSVESEMQFLAHEHALEILEVPITINYHENPKRNVISHGLIVLNGILQLIGQHRPLLFFGVPGVLLVALGILLGVHVTYIYHNARQLAIGTALISILLCIIGVFTCFTGIILHSIRGLLLSNLEQRGELHG